MSAAIGAPPVSAVSTELEQAARDMVALLVEADGAGAEPVVVIEAGWQGVAAVLGLAVDPAGVRADANAESEAAPTVAIGSGPFVSAAVLTALGPLPAEPVPVNEPTVGFVTPVAHHVSVWSRGRSQTDDATLRMWRAGCTPNNVRRVEIAVDDGTVEFAVGCVRPTPSVSALEDAD